MWPQSYAPVAGSLELSALVAVLPVFVVLLLLGVLRKPAWVAAIAGFIASAIISVAVYNMPFGLAINSALYGAANGMLPIGWIVFTAILLYRVTVDTGKFDIIKDSLGSVTSNRSMQALLIAFAFGGFIEGAAGFGTPVAIAAAMLAGLGFPPFLAASVCLLANTAPVAFGSIGTPLIMLQRVTNLPIDGLSADVGRLCAPLALILPSYLMLVMGGLPALRAALPAAIVCGVAFGGVQFLISSFIGPNLAGLLAAIAAMGALLLLLRFWTPVGDESRTKSRHTPGEIFLAWSPYLLLVIFVLLWGSSATKAILDKATVIIPWPGLHNLITRMPPITPKPAPYGAPYTLNLLSASGTSCLFAVFASALVLRVSPPRLARLTWLTAKQLALPLVTIASVVALAFIMNYSGQTATLGLVAAKTGAAFPFFSTLLGWLGVFLTGSDTSANALFGTLQVVTANQLGLNPVLMAAANSSGGVMGKMISLQSIAVAAAATGMARSEESNLLRFTLKHSVFLVCLIGLLAMFYTYVVPSWVR
ncbi:MAG TPA: L-lactate permease [Bryobacteraceae bacterium]|nr:L-lactate permease [Bryobacteraceae bacterium]